MPDDQGVELPSERQIAEAAAEIRAGWSESEHRKRAGVNAVQPVDVDVGQLGVNDGRRQA